MVLKVSPELTVLYCKHHVHICPHGMLIDICGEKNKALKETTCWKLLYCSNENVPGVEMTKVKWVNGD